MRLILKGLSISVVTTLFVAQTPLFITSAFAQDQIVKPVHSRVVAPQDRLAFQIVDSYQKGFSALYVSKFGQILRYCTDIRETGCESGLSADVILPICENNLDMNCIESVYLITEDMLRKKLTHVRSIRTKDDYVYKPALEQGLPEPGQISLWTDGDSQDPRFYSINASLALNSSVSASELVFDATELAIEINEYVERKAAITLAIGPMQGSIAAGWNPPASIENIQCAWHEVGLCGVSQVMNVNQSFEISIRIPKTISGWIYGRLGGQNIKIEDLNEKQKRIIITGSPVEVPGIIAETDFSKESQLVFEYARQAGWTMPTEIRTPMVQFIKSDLGLSTILSAFSSILQDKAQYTNTKWSIYTKPVLNASPRTAIEYRLRECMSNEKGLQGFVTSNAPVYESAPPIFDGESLNYKVSGTHFKSDGTLFEGSYNLSIRSSLARCIYGFSSAPISASVSIVNSDGESKIKTTTFNETSDGWMNLSAAGFTFSSPTIKIVLNQEKSPEPSPTPEPTVTKKKNKIILCQKKKTVKKISGINPKCPAGYKRTN